MMSLNGVFNKIEKGFLLQHCFAPFNRHVANTKSIQKKVTLLFRHSIQNWQGDIITAETLLVRRKCLGVTLREVGRSYAI